MNLNSILVPLDGSRFAETALPLGTAIARKTEARIRLVLVHPAAPAVGLGGEGAALAATVREREAEYLMTTARELDTGGDLSVETAHLAGYPGPELAVEVERGGDDLIVMATHGRGAVNRLWLGSVADYLIRHVSVPLLLIRPDPQQKPAERTTRFNHLLIPLDSSERSEAILDPALSITLGGEGPVRVTLLTVVEPVLGAGEPGLPVAVPLDPRMLEEQRRAAEARLARTAQRLRSDGLRVETRVVSGAQAAAAILEEAERAAVDLVAMSTHGAGGLRRILLGSVADKVIRGASVPVLVLRPASG